MSKIEEEYLNVTKEDAIMLHENSDVKKILESISRSVTDNLRAIDFYDDEEKVIDVYKKIQEQETKLMISVVKEMYKIHQKSLNEKKNSIEKEENGNIKQGIRKKKRAKYKSRPDELI